MLRGKAVDDANTYRIGHPLAERVVAAALALAPPDAEVTFDLTGSGRNIAALSPHVGKGGWLAIDKLTITALDAEDEIVFAGQTDEGATLGLDECRRLFDLPARAGSAITAPVVARAGLEHIVNLHKEAILGRLMERDGKSFDIENDKLDKWADDRRSTLKADLDDLDEAIKAAKKSARVAPNQPEKHQRQREVRKLESKRNDAFRAYDEASRAVEAEKDRILDDIAARLQQATKSERLFTVRWRLV